MCPSRLHVGMPLLGVAQKLFRPRPNNIWACFGVGPQDANQGTPKTCFRYWKIIFGQVLGWLAGQGAESVLMSLFLEGTDQGTPKTCFGHWKIIFGQVLGWFAGQGAESVQMSFYNKLPPKENNIYQPKVWK